MSRNNDVFQVLVAKTALVEPATPVGDLAVDQIGIFDSQTNLSVDVTKPPKEFYIAVGISDGQGGTVLADINKSAGQMIQKDNIRYYQAQPYTEGKPEIVEISGFTAKCDTEYGIKLEFRNQKIYNLQGYNQFSKTYITKTGCCGDGCDPCAPQDPNELVKQFVAAINADKDGLAIAEAIDATEAVIADIDAFIATNKAVNTDADLTNDVVAKIRITTVPLNVYRFCDINLMYYKPRETSIIVSLTAGFECAGVIDVTQDATYEQGAGYDVKQREYKAGGWNGRPGPYREGTAKNNFRYFADTAVKYNRVNLTYDQFSIGGWQEYLNNLATEIYFPVSAKTEVAAFIGVLEAILPSGFESQAAKFA